MIQRRPKVLIIQNILTHYRVPLYNHLQEVYGDITILHGGKKSTVDQINFNEVLLKDMEFKGYYYNFSFYKHINSYDIIVGMYDLRWLNIWIIPLLKPKTKFMFWGIGVSTESGFDVDKSKDSYRFKIGKLAKALIFYSELPIKKYIDAGFDPKKLFVAPNTIAANHDFQIENRTFQKFLFIGSITARKKILELIDAFEEVMSDIPEYIKLEIIGDGPAKASIVSYVNEKGLNNRVIVNPGFYGEDKTEVFRDAICTISLGQAGLSVLESLAYGVPFATYADAITGGEKSNVINDYNGFLLQDKEEAKKMLIKMVDGTIDVRKMSENSRTYYVENRQIKHMANGFITAFNYLRGK
ncbi:MAG: glycosyltransferase [Pedobacter sp.]|nr:MAG: glycosyltransferase [Pedobacter sp.]